MKRLVMISMVFLVLLGSCQDMKTKPLLKTNRELKANLIKENFHKFIEEGWNKKDLSAFKNISAQEFVKNLNGITIAKHQNEMEANMIVYFTGFPDVIITVYDTVMANNRLFVHWNFSGTNTGIFGDSPPTGKKVKISGCSTLQFNEDGKMTREDTYYNELEMLQQLGYTLNPPILK